MRKDDRIYVAGHAGLAGSAIVRCLRAAGYTNLITRTRAQLDLRDQIATQTFFQQERPEYVFLAAAKVGGILANASYPAQFLYDNLAIQTHVIHAAYLSGVTKLLFLGSSCIYPKFSQQPIPESALMSGPLEPTNEAYGVAKIAGLKMCAAYNRQYGTDFLCVMPTNLYGPGDNYDVRNAHVLPALLRRLHEARAAEAPSVTVWGTGTPLREFMHSDDMASACVFLMEHCHADTLGEFVNVGTGEEISIADLARRIARRVWYAGRLEFDASRPDGTPRKVVDVSRLHALGWHHRIALDDGLRHTYECFLREALAAA